ncbi:FAD-dependent monooxygenase [Kribbella turkmenica]|uniref:FAD-dependent monooxygenase n=1 Tax=Kribbella turkmenica TaxID=2530375 RepID=A0A4R4WFM2_9ACTN|nr:NAD(P)/FAD-dependent oxidoreductase [Kribbella turkmenica]TDD15073.1 FAD-dependent monooxygenase [Kribbella turkmenica]
MKYDAIVVGARVAGSPTAMLLARKGYRVLVVDRATFPSDTLSTHIIHAPGVAALRRWGLLDRMTATGCPPIERYSFDFGPFVISGTTSPVDGIDVGYAPRRTVLDKLLVDAARESGAEVREGCNVDEVIVDNQRVRGIRCNGHEYLADLVIGADGRNSRVAKTVGAEDYNTMPKLEYGYYTYFSGLPVSGIENYARPDRGFGVAPTNHGLTMVVVGWPYAEARAYKSDVAGNFYRTIAQVPSFAARLGRATQEAPFVGGAVAGWFRKPYGDGYALVGDAAYNKDPITAQGITDAFHDAERCNRAVDDWLQGRAPFEDAMSAWHRERDARAMPMYEFTSQLATLEPPPPQMQQLLGAVSADQRSMDGFVSVMSGALSPADFFAEENLGRVFAAARQPA